MFSLALFVALSADASAQEPVALPTPSAPTASWDIRLASASSEPIRTERTRVRAKKLRDAGIATTTVGLVFMGLGSGLGLYGVGSLGSCNEGCMGPIMAMGIGGVTSLAAVPFVAAGGSMWGVGQRRMNQASVSVAPVIGPRQTGLSLRVSGF